MEQVMDFLNVSTTNIYLLFYNVVETWALNPKYRVWGMI